MEFIAIFAYVFTAVLIIGSSIGVLLLLGKFKRIGYRDAWNSMSILKKVGYIVIPVAVYSIALISCFFSMLVGGMVFIMGSVVIGLLIMNWGRTELFPVNAS